MILKRKISSYSIENSTRIRYRSLFVKLREDYMALFPKIGDLVECTIKTYRAYDKYYKIISIKKSKDKYIRIKNASPVKINVTPSLEKTIKIIEGKYISVPFKSKIGGGEHVRYKLYSLNGSVIKDCESMESHPAETFGKTIVTCGKNSYIGFLDLETGNVTYITDRNGSKIPTYRWVVCKDNWLLKIRLQAENCWRGDGPVILYDMDTMEIVAENDSDIVSSSNMLFIKKGETYDMIDYDGNVLRKHISGFGQGITDDTYIIHEDEKWNVVNINGELMLDKSYKHIYPEGDILKCKDDDGLVVYDSNFEKKIDMKGECIMRYHKWISIIRQTENGVKSSYVLHGWNPVKEYDEELFFMKSGNYLFDPKADANEMFRYFRIIDDGAFRIIDGKTLNPVSDIVFKDKENDKMSIGRDMMLLETTKGEWYFFDLRNGNLTRIELDDRFIWAHFYTDKLGVVEPLYKSVPIAYLMNRNGEKVTTDSEYRVSINLDLGNLNCFLLRNSKWDFLCLVDENGKELWSANIKGEMRYDKESKELLIKKDNVVTRYDIHTGKRKGAYHT